MSKPVKFNTKIYHDGKIYLKATDVAKALDYDSKKLFMQDNGDFIVKIKGVGDCIREIDYNTLLEQDISAFEKQGHIEVTRIETLTHKIDLTLKTLPLMTVLARNYFEKMSQINNCSIEEFAINHELPKKSKESLHELIQKNDNNTFYKQTVKFLRDEFGNDQLKKFDLDIQYLTSIQPDGRLMIDAYILGKGVFCYVNEDTNEAWEAIEYDENGNLILQFYDTEEIINLSNVEVERDFRQFNVLDNLMWCVENLNIDALEDYEYAVISYYKDTIKFDIGIELLAKIIRPDRVATIFIDNIVDVVEETYITDVEEEKVFFER